MGLHFEQTKLSKSLWLVAALLVSAATGYAIGYWQTPNIQQRESRFSETEVAPSANKAKGRPSQAQDSSKARHLVEQESDSVKEGIVDSAFSLQVESVTEGIDTLQNLISLGDQKSISEVKQQLLNLAKRDDIALKQLLLSLSDNLSNELLKDEVLQMVGSIRDPQVENYAQSLVKLGTRQQQLAGLEIIGRLGLANEESLDLAFSALQNNQDDPETLQMAMYAMPAVTVASEKNAIILSRLSELAAHPDESVRSASILQVAKHAKTSEQLAPLFELFDSGSIDDKISVAMAIEQSHIVGERLKSVLIKNVTNRNELPEVLGNGSKCTQSFRFNRKRVSVDSSFP